MDVDSFGKGGKKGKKGNGDGKNSKKGGTGQNQSLNSTPIKEVVCWHCGNQGHLSTQCWSNPKSQSGFGGGHHKGGKDQSTAQAKERALWNKETKLQLWNSSRN